MTTAHPTPDEIPELWCRMWSEDASLAHRLLTDDARQWSGVKPGLDTVVGPKETEEFIRRYQREVGNVFTPRTYVIDGSDRLAYTWDVTLRDGSVLTGADVCVLRDGLVADNWTIPSYDGRSSLPDGPGRDVRPVEGALDRRGILDLTAGAHPWHREPVVDVDRQTVGGTWTDGERGGIAVLVVADGRVDREWVIPGTRPLLY